MINLAWNQGAIVAQACHAATKCIATFFNDDLVCTYTDPVNINNMTKIVLGVTFGFMFMHFI